MENIRFETHLNTPTGLLLIIRNGHINNEKPRRGNLHENIEILYFYEGSGGVTLDAVTYRVSPGDFVVANANVAHNIFCEQKLSYLCLILFREFTISSGLDTNSLYFTPFFRDDIMAHMMRELREEYEQPERTFRATALRAKSLEILVHLARNHSGAGKSQDGGIARAISYIKIHYAEPLTVGEIARHVGYSTSYLSHEFHARTGNSVVEYINLVRCEFSKSLLSTPNISIGDVCERCGYRNDSYYTRTFRKFNGITPSEYRRLALRNIQKQ